MKRLIVVVVSLGAVVALGVCLKHSFKTAADQRIVEDAVKTLVSPETDFSRRRESWRRLENAGELEEAIKELDRRAAEGPPSVACLTGLGECCYRMAGISADFKDKAFLAVKADKSLADALQLDPSNWEARFVKTVGLSYWPAQYDKGAEVIAQFNLLIEQQEKQTPQPQFARTYVRLGEQYEAMGRRADAAKVWQRGANLFPDDADLKHKPTAAP